MAGLRGAYLICFSRDLLMGRVYLPLSFFSKLDGRVTPVNRTLHNALSSHSLHYGSRYFH